MRAVTLQPRLAWEVARKDLKLFLADRRGAVLCFAVPVLLASAFGAIFHRPAGADGVRDSQSLPEIGLGLSDQATEQGTHVEQQGGAAQLVTKRLRETTFSRTGDPEQQNTARLDGPAGLEGPAAEVLEVRQASQGIEPLGAPVEAEEIVLLEGLGLQLPHSLGLQSVVASQRQGEGPLGFIARETSGRIQDSLQILALR